jgi:hypothetical protein
MENLAAYAKKSFVLSQLENVGFGRKWISGRVYLEGEIVWNPTDSLTYVCIKDTETVQPDYTNATANTYWTWIAGSISGYVAGRGWWKKDADGTLTQWGTFTFSMVAGTAVGINYTYPIAFYNDGTVGPGVSWSVHPATYWTYKMVGDFSSYTTFSPVYDYAGTTQNVVIKFIAVGRWK